ncbi:MAG: CocE/NonD family hydrolase, partial [Candidatus Cryptobacteroides sp.]
GAVNTYRLIKEQSPKTELYFAYGPWYHGGWRDTSYSSLGEAQFAQGLYDHYIYNVEYPFFRHYLEGEGDAPAAVSVAVSGTDRWMEYDCWPPRQMKATTLYLRENGSLSTSSPSERQSFTEYVSNPDNPVPFMERPDKRDKAYMAADQSFAREREDVLSFMMDVTDTLRLEGPVGVRLFVSTSTTDADFIVKLADVAPDGRAMLLRGEVFRAKYRRSLSSPVPMRPGKIEEISFTMNDIAHHILPGDKLEVQVQSTWFPLVDLNPQTFVENIYQAREEDFRKATIRVCHQRGAASCLVLPVVE